MSRFLYTFVSAVLVTSSLAAQEAPKETVKKPDPAVAEAAVPEMGLARFAGSYADLAESSGDLAAMLLGGAARPKSFYRLIEQLREFGSGERTELLLDLTGGFNFNPAQMMEMERCLRELRKGGKKLFAYMEHASSAEMQIASQCDKVVIADMGMIELPSVALSVTFMKDALDLLGVEMEVVRCGEFKGAVEPYMLSRMSSHLKKHYTEMIGRINADVVRRIASGRGISANKVQELQAQRLINARQALAAGLVDEIVPWIGAERAIEKVCGHPVKLRNAIVKKQRKSVNFFTLMTNLLNPKAAEDEAIEGGLVVLHLSGGIVDGAKALPGSIVSGPTVKVIRQVTRDDNVKGVVVRVNSPGGSATASEAIVLALRELAAKKPVVFSMGRVAASGGYYVTCVGRPILAEAGTITGSIGVFGMKPNVGALMRRIGIHEEIVGLDEGADMASLDKSWTPEQRKLVQGFVDDVYDRFTSHVSASRKMPVTDVLKIAGGRVWSGEQAVDIGLVDKIGGLDAAIAMVAAEAKLGDTYQITHLPKPVDPVDAIMRELVGVRAALTTSTLERLAHSAGRFDGALRIVIDALTQKQPTRLWMMLPEGLEIR